MEDELPGKLEEAGNAGYNEAGEYYRQQVEGIVKKAFKEGELKGIKDTHNTSFLRGYQNGLDYAEVPKANHRREPPVVPPMELPGHLLPAEQLNPTSDTTLNPINDSTEVWIFFFVFASFVPGACKEQFARTEPQFCKDIR